MLRLVTEQSEPEGSKAPWDGATTGRLKKKETAQVQGRQHTVQAMKAAQHCLQAAPLQDHTANISHYENQCAGIMGDSCQRRHSADTR
jgi:hypothetical protein